MSIRIAGLVLGTMMFSARVWAQDGAAQESPADGVETSSPAPSDPSAAPSTAAEEQREPDAEADSPPKPSAPLPEKLSTRAPSEIPDVSQMIAYLEFVDGRSRIHVGSILLFVTALPLIVSGSALLAGPAERASCNKEDETRCAIGGVFIGAGIVSAVVGVVMIASGVRKRDRFSRFIDWTRFELESASEQPPVEPSQRFSSGDRL